MNHAKQPPNIEMKPTLFTVHVLMSPQRAAHFARWATNKADTPC